MLQVSKPPGNQPSDPKRAWNTGETLQSNALLKNKLALASVGGKTIYAKSRLSVTSSLVQIFEVVGGDVNGLVRESQ